MELVHLLVVYNQLALVTKGQQPDPTSSGGVLNPGGMNDMDDSSHDDPNREVTIQISQFPAPSRPLHGELVTVQIPQFPATGEPVHGELQHQFPGGMGLLMESSSRAGQAGNDQWSCSFQAGMGLVMDRSSRASLTGNYLNNPKCSSQAGSSLAGLVCNYLNSPKESST